MQHIPFDCCNAMNIVSLLACLVLVGIIVGFSYNRGAAYIEWAYHIGDQPVYRLLFLVLIVLAAHYSYPLALLLALLFMVINSMVPMLTELDENFVEGAPVTDCAAYSKKNVDEVGTPFYPLNNVRADESGHEGGVPVGVV